MPNTPEPIILKAKAGYTFAGFTALPDNKDDILTIIEVFRDIHELANEFDHSAFWSDATAHYPFYQIILPRTGTWKNLERRQKAIRSTPTIILGPEEDILKFDLKVFTPAYKGNFELRLIRLDVMLGENRLLHAEERIMMSIEFTALQIEIRDFTNQRLSGHYPLGPAIAIDTDILAKIR